MRKIIASMLIALTVLALPAAQTGSRVVNIGSAKFTAGTGSPEGAVTGNVGDVYTRTDGSTGAVLYVKATGTGNTGWEAAGAGGGGGSSLVHDSATVLTTQTQASNTAYDDLATVGPAVTLATGTTATIFISATAGQTSAGNSGFISVAISGATTLAASHDNAAIVSSAGASYDNNLSRVVSFTGLTPGNNTFTIKYSNNGGGTWSFSRRTIAAVAPVATGGVGDYGMKLLETKTASASASLSFTTCITSTYDDYKFRFVGVLPATDAADFHARFSTNGGSSYDSSALYDEAWRYNATNNTASGFGGVNGTQMSVGGDEDNGATGGMFGEMSLGNPLSATTYKSFWGSVHYKHDTVGQIFLDRSFIYRNAAAVNAVRFFYDTGNITEGTIRCYGMTK